MQALRGKLSIALRAAVTAQNQEFERAQREADATLLADSNWRALSAADQQAFRHQRGLSLPPAPSIKTDQDLLEELNRQPLKGRADAVGAVPEKMRQVMADAAKKLQPKARRFSLRPATLVTADEVRAWVEEQQKRLLDEVKQGPVIVG